MRAEQQADSGENHDVTNDPPAGQDGLDRAILALGEAVRDKKVDPICAAYLGVHSAARGMKIAELCDRIVRDLGDGAVQAVVSAFSHRRCFMCADGMLPCEHCEDTGQIEPGRRCPHCDGYGRVICGFCQGTGWADLDTVPTEIRSSVLNRQFAHVKSELQRLLKAAPGLSEQKIKRLAPQQRDAMIAWIVRLSAQLAFLHQTHTIDKQHEDHLLSLIPQVDKTLEMFRKC